MAEPKQDKDTKEKTLAVATNEEPEEKNTEENNKQEEVQEGADQEHLDQATKKKKKSRKKSRAKSNPETILVDGNEVNLNRFIKEHKKLTDGVPKLNKFQRKAIRRYHREEALKPY
jgi:hypothetical protein